MSSIWCWLMWVRGVWGEDPEVLAEEEILARLLTLNLEREPA